MNKYYLFIGQEEILLSTAKVFISETMFKEKLDVIKTSRHYMPVLKMKDLLEFIKKNTFEADATIFFLEMKTNVRMHSANNINEIVEYVENSIIEKIQTEKPQTKIINALSKVYESIKEYNNEIKKSELKLSFEDFNFFNDLAEKQANFKRTLFSYLLTSELFVDAMIKEYNTKLPPNKNNVFQSFECLGQMPEDTDCKIQKMEE